MKEKNNLILQGKKIFQMLGQGKYILIVMLAGVLFLMWPHSETAEEKNTVDITEEVSIYAIDDIEKRLEDLLSTIEGAGTVRVMLSVDGGVKRIYVQDKDTEQEDGSIKSDHETVVISKGSGIEEAVLIQQIFPEFKGALVVASGGNDPSVRLKLTEAVTAVTGLGADRISVCKGK